MEVLYPKCDGLDMHQHSVVACVRMARGRRSSRVVEKFPTITGDLSMLVDWLSAQQVTHVAMESTGVYWKPIWHVSTAHFDLILANFLHVRGRAWTQNRRV